MNDKQHQHLHKLLARVVLQNESKILLVRRSNHDTRPGVWELPGGGVDSGESFEEAARREVSEETGIIVDELTYLDSLSYKAGSTQRMAVLFEASSAGSEVILSNEHDEYRWCEASNFHNLKIEEPTQNILQRYISSDIISNNVDKSTSNLVVDAYSDGGSRGNPGPSATGYVIYDQHKNILAEGGEYLGVTTNNQAEYQAVKKALEECLSLGASEVNFYVDSLLVVNQMSGAFKIKNRDLWPIHESIKQLVEKFRRVDFTHIPREQNRFADSKVNEVLDGRV